MQLSHKLLLLPAMLALMSAASFDALAESNLLSLGGVWHFRLDPKDEGVAARWWEGRFDETLRLPGTTALAGKGEPLMLDLNLERPAMQHLHQRFRYVGPAWYQRTFQVPASWKGRDVRLMLERVIWESRVWVNGVEVGEPQLSLTTPHRYDLGSLVRPGQENMLVVRIDNREKVAIGNMGHAYTDETQTIWNGIVGKMLLEAKPKLRIEGLQLRPDLARSGVQVTLSLVNHTERPRSATLTLSCSAGSEPLVQEVSVAPGESRQQFFLKLPGSATRWSEFSPVTHVVSAVLARGKTQSRTEGVMGLREFKAEGRVFTINGRRTFLRGTVNCAEFPETGHPDMSGAQWEKIFRTAREHGLNHMRFHSWCPPEAAFAAADRHGFYLQVELPNWTFKMGQTPLVDNWLLQEGERIFREYGNHPSFVMFSLGNELAGDYAKMDQMIERLRALEPRLQFTSTTFSFSPRGKLPGSQDNYFVSQETQCGWVRGQGFLNHTPPNTTSDYAQGMACIPVPLVTHEVGQYVVYPNLAELPKYETAPVRATAWEAIRADLERKGRLAEAPRYTRDSGKLAALLYKEDLERALRTKDLAGIQLLQLQDFPGQSTATVGLLDAFWDSKGILAPEQFRQFCGPTVPLVRMERMVYHNEEVFEAAMEIAHFGPEPLTNATVIWKLRQQDRIVGQGRFTSQVIPLGNGISLGQIRQSFHGVTDPSRLQLHVAIEGSTIANEWAIWVFPKSGEAVADHVAVFQNAGEDCYEALRQGRKVLLLPSRASVKAPLDGRFIPVFWSPLHFPNQPGTLGASIEREHPVWGAFPTDTHTDWQWWELLSRSFAVDLAGLAGKLTAPMRFVDKYNRNALPATIFEAAIGSGRLLVCTLDITSDLDKRLAARQLRRSILAYMAGDQFQPRDRLEESALRNLFRPVSYTVRASSAHDSYAAELAVDGNIDTFWHTDWLQGDKLPARIELDLGQENLLRGFACVPRQDMDRGRIHRYYVEVSRNGKDWLRWGNEEAFPNTSARQMLTFERPVQARFLRLVALSDHGAAHQAAVAELEPFSEPITSDVRDLGVVPGFNDRQ
jgi:hypothetical protein